MSTTLQSLDELDGRVPEIIAFAHDLKHWIDLEAGETLASAVVHVTDKAGGTVMRPNAETGEMEPVVAYHLADYLSFVVHQPGAESALHLDYAVVRQKGCWWRRVAFGMTVHGVIRQGQLAMLMENGADTPWHMLMSMLATRFFPNRDRVRTSHRALPPRPVVDPNDHERLLHHRTPISIAMYVEWDQTPSNLHVVKGGQIT